MAAGYFASVLLASCAGVACNARVLVHCTPIQDAEFDGSPYIADELDSRKTPSNPIIKNELEACLKDIHDTTKSELDKAKSKAEAVKHYLGRAQLHRVYIDGLQLQSMFQTMKVFGNLAAGWLTFLKKNPRLGIQIQLGVGLGQMLAQRLAAPRDQKNLQNAMFELEIMARPLFEERYSKTILSTSFRSGNDFSELTDLRKEDAIRLAADPSQMPHTGWTSDSDRFFEVRTQENEAKKEVEGYVPKSVIREGGDTCSSFVVRTNQTAALQIAAAAEAERVLGVNPDAAYPSEPARSRLREAIQPTLEGEVNEDLKKKLTDTLTGIGGLLANNAEGIAPKTVEHFCRNEHDFKFVGVLTVAPADVLREEMRFDADGNPIVSSNTSTTGSVGSDKSGCCTVS